MTLKQKRFIQEYLKDANGAAAAIRAGYSPRRARIEAHELLTRPIIREAIDQQLEALTMASAEAIKRVTDIARSRLNDYFIIEKKLVTTETLVPLKTIIEQLQAEYDREAGFAIEAGLTGAELTKHEAGQKLRHMQLIRYQVELRFYPNKELVRPLPEWVETVRLDVVALAKAKEKGLIKTFREDKHGITVEFYSAHEALTTILRFHGKLVKKIDHTTGGKSFLDFMQSLDAQSQPFDAN